MNNKNINNGDFGSFGGINKKILIFGVIILLLLIGGVFLWKEDRGYESTVIEEVKFEPSENYTIKETSEGKFVENRNAGLSFKVPEGWDVGLVEYREGEGTIEIFTSDIVFYPNTKLPREGCLIGVNIEYRDSEKEFKLLKNIIEELEKNSITELDRKVIEVGKYKGLQRITFEKLEMGRSISVEVPISEGKTYIFSTFFSMQEENRCFNQFNEFLKIVSIE